MPKIIIDNREIEVPAGTKVIEAAERLGIMIPRFCYHPALGSVGACRVCAVAFKEGPVKGIQMSCMVDAVDEMVVSTTDPEAVGFRRSVIEWLMLNHPHDCPVCDVGGNCLLQDMTVSGGHGLRRFPGLKRTHNDQYLGPLIQHEMNRCIQCYRCSRYYQEFSGYRDLGVMGSAARVYFGRSRPGRLKSPFAGNLLEVCPTGVYTDKPSRYLGRRWEFERAPSVCLHCSLGCNLITSARYRQVVRQEARLNEDVNGHFICDRGRYGYPYASEKARPRQPRINGQAAEIDPVFDQVGKKLIQIAERFGPESVATVGSARSSLEALAVLRHVTRDNHWQGPAVSMTQRGAENLKTATRLLTSETAISLSEVSSADAAVVIGADPVNEAPMLALALRQAYRGGGHVTTIDPRAVKLPFTSDHWAVHPAGLPATIEDLIGEVAAEPKARPADPARPTMNRRLQALSDRLKSSRKPVVICGTDIVTCREVELAAQLAATLRSRDIDAGLFYPLLGANSFAAGLMAIAGQRPASIEQLLDPIEQGRIRALVIVESDLWQQFPDRQRLTDALHRLELLVVVDYIESGLSASAQFFIPTQTIYESGGQWINQEGRLQVAETGFGGGEPIEISGGQGHPPRKFEVDAPGTQPVETWRALSVIAQKANMGDKGPPIDSPAAAVGAFHPGLAAAATAGGNQRPALEQTPADPTADRPISLEAEAMPADQLTVCLVDWIFGTEPLSSRSPVLSQEAQEPSGSMHPGDIQRLGLEAGQPVTIATDRGSVTLSLTSDDAQSPGTVVIPRHHMLDWQIFQDTVVNINPDQIISK